MPQRTDGTQRLRKGSQRRQPCAICGTPFLRSGRQQRCCSLACGVVLRERSKREREANADSYIREQFWRRVETTPTCWLWTGAVDEHGYGSLTSNRTRHRAHRLSYELMVGPIPDGLVIDHLCRVRNCVRPDHLRAVTLAENTMAVHSLSPSRINRDRTHCLHGHEFSAANTHRDSAGKRHCRTCGLRKTCRSGHEFTPENTFMRRGKRRCLTCAQRLTR